MSYLGDLDAILKKDGFVIYIGGPKEKGKTDFSLLIAEVCYLCGYRKVIATNIYTESYMVQDQITNLPDLKTWLKRKGRKLYILDEAGLHLRKMRFMSSKNLEIMDIIQLIRHYDSGFVGIAPSPRFIDSTFMDTDILDAKITKLSKATTKIYNKMTMETTYINDTPRTSIKFNTKDQAKFTIEKKKAFSELALCCKVARLWYEKATYKEIKDKFPEINNDEQIRRLLHTHLKHVDLQLTTTEKVAPPLPVSKGPL